MEILKKAYEIIDQKRDEIISTLQQFIAIRKRFDQDTGR